LQSFPSLPFTDETKVRARSACAGSGCKPHPSAIARMASVVLPCLDQIVLPQNVFAWLVGLMVCISVLLCCSVGDGSHERGKPRLQHFKAFSFRSEWGRLISCPGERALTRVR